MNKNKIHIILLTLIIILAAFLRIYHINSAPAGIYPDEANNGTNAYDAQLNNNYQWFYPDNNGREGLYINLIALSFKFFGVSIFTLKLTSILMGILTVLGVYFLCKELFIGKPRLALIASYLTAVSFWAINFSRIGFRAILMLPITTFSAYFLLRGIRENKKIYYIIGGFIFGLGFHTYIAFRIAPPLFLILIVFFIISQKKFICEKWFGLVLFGIFAFISTLPMLITFKQHPEYLNSRTGDVSIFSVTDENIATTLTKTIGLSLGKFNFYGDQNWRHNYPPHPILEPFVGVMFLIGIFTLAFIFFKLLFVRFKNKTQNKRLVTYTFLLAWFVAFLAPEFMTIEGLPHALRSIGTLPVVYIFAAYTLNYIIDYSEKFSSKIHKIVFAITIILLIYVGIFNSLKYHVYWANEVEQARSFDKSLTDIAFYVQKLPAETTKYVFGDPLKRLPIELLNEKTPNLIFLYEQEVEKIDFTKELIIITTNNEELLKLISENAIKKNVKLKKEIKLYDLESEFIVLTPQ